MSTKYKATMPDTGYFVTITIVGCCGHGLQIRHRVKICFQFYYYSPS
jgi:hypothetical protein